MKMHFYKVVYVYIWSKWNFEFQTVIYVKMTLDIAEVYYFWLDPPFVHTKFDDVAVPKLNVTSTRSVFTSRRLHK